MANAKTIQVNLKAVADISDVTSNVKQIQTALSGLTLSKGLESQFTKIFGNVEKNAEKASNALATGFKTKGDVTAYEKATNLIVEDMKKISQLMGQIDTSKLDFEVDASKSKALLADIKQLRQEIDAIRSQNLAQLQQLVNNKPSGAKAWQDFFDAFQRGDDGIEDAQKALNRLQTELKKAQDAGKDFSAGSHWDTYKQGVETCAQALQILEGKTGVAAVKQNELNQKTQELNNLQQQANATGTAWLQNLVSGYQKVVPEAENYVRAQQKGASSTAQLNSELDQFKSRITYFFGMNNAVNLFQRAIRSAYETVKELDEVMTETAVVTDFDVSDMWSQLPEYTERANQLGVSIQDVYESMTIFYQQGLDTNEAVALSNETLKMARIAGLDAAEATDRMTNALRGFNMELNETNAQRVDDVYNKLAAISASNVDEISTAMTKVASLANSANMEFETTSAFLAQMIETTRESAETAGTALKTVVARFSEVKSLYSEGELLGTDSEGEEIDVNKVSTALRTAGINLNEYLTGAKGLDDIFLELAEKWDSLDIVQQRYIATMAAGSRQQSRFIAMMSDYERTMELVDAANNSAGAANEMYEKTLESLETKLNQLKNAWDTFLMGLTENEVIKIAVDALTDLITGINNLLNTLSGGNGVIKSIETIVGALAGASILKKVFSGVTAKFGQNLLTMLKGGETIIEGESKTYQAAGSKLGIDLSSGLKQSLSKGSHTVLDTIKKSFANRLTPKELGIDGDTLINFKDLDFSGLDSSGIAQLKSDLTSQLYSMDDIGDGSKTVIANLIDQGSFDEANQALIELRSKTDQVGQGFVLTGYQATQLGATLNNSLKQVNAMGAACASAGSLLMIIASKMDSTSKSGRVWSNVLKAVGVALMAMPVILKVVQVAFETFGKSISATIYNIPIIGWIALVITALTTLIAIIASVAQENSYDAQLEELTKATENAKAAAEGAKTAYDELLNDQSEYNTLQETLEDLTDGTNEWKQALAEANQKVLELLSTYPELAEYISRGEDGQLTITTEGWEEVIENAKAAVAVTSAQTMKAQINEQAFQKEHEYQLTQNKFAVAQYDYDGNFTGYDYQIDLQNALNDLSISSDDYETSLQELSTEYGYSVVALKSMHSALIDYDQFAAESAIKISSYAKTALTSLASDDTTTSEFSEQIIDAFSRGMSADMVVDGSYNQLIDDEVADMKQKNNAQMDSWDNVVSEDFVRLAKQYKVSSQMGNDAVENLKILYAKMANLDVASDEVQNMSREQLATAIAEMDQTQQLADAMNNFEQTFSQLDEEEQSKIAALIGQDIGNLSLLEASNLGDLSDYSLFADMSDDEKNMLSVQMGYENFEQLEAETQNAIDTQITQLEQSYQSIADATGKTLKDENGNYVSEIAQLSKAVAENLIDQMEPMGQEAASQYFDAFNAVIENADADDKNLLSNYLSTVDTTDLNALLDALDYMQDMGIDSSLMESYWNAAVNGSNAYIKNLSTALSIQNKLNTELSSIQAIENALADGSATYDQLQQLIDAGVDVSKFQLTSEGWSATAEQIEAATAAMREYNIEKTQAVIEQNQSAYNEAAANKHDFAVQNESGEWVTAKNYDDHINVVAENLKTLGFLAEEDIEDVDAINNAFIDYLNYLNTFEQQQILLQQQLDYAEASQYTAMENLSHMYEGENVSSESIAYSAQNEISELGLDVDEFNEFASAVQNANTELSDIQATMAALGNTKLNAGLSEIIDSYEDWTALIDESTGLIRAETSDDVAAFNKLKKSVNTMLNTAEDLSDEFWNSATNMENLQKAAEGDTKALAALQKAAAIDYLSNLDLSERLHPEEATAAVDNFINKLNEIEIPELNVGDKWDTSGAQEFIDSFNAMALAADMTSAEIQSAVQAMGFNATITYQEDTRKIPIEHTKRVIDAYDPKTGEAIEWHTQTWEDGASEVTGLFPVVETLTASGSGGGGVSIANKNSGASNKPSSSSGGGGGSSDTSKSWENPYDELYNLTEKINENLRERESLERKYDRLLKSRTATSRDLIRASLDEIANLEKEADLQRQLLSSRERQLANIGSEKYQDDEGNISTFSQLGVTKYASYDTSTGLITIDWNAIDSVTDEDTGAAIEAYISKLEELSESYEEAADRLDEIEDEVAEIRDQGKEDYLELEERVYDAIVEQEQKIIDGYSELNDTITDTNSDIIDSLQDSIDLERQIRDNTEKEEDIADKEQRLAYLQRDTSGANALEILQLQEEIEDARQDYQDSLIDQAIDQLSKDNDLAADQRAKQIEIMQAQLDYNESNGAYWDQVNELLRGAFNADGTLNNNSALIQLLEESEAFSGLSYFGKKNWINEMATTWLQAQEGFSNWMVEDAEDTGSVTLSDGTKLTYKDGKWYDKSGNEWQDLSYDMQTGQYSATKIEKAVETPTTTATSTVSTGREITQDIKNGVSGAIWNGNQGWGTGSTRSSRLTEVFGPNNGIQSLVNQRVGINMSPSSTTAYSYANMKAINWKKYAEGGIADFTGPAWLDGTKSKPEMVLSAADTQNFIQLKNILAQLLQGAQGINSTGGGDNYFDISIAADIGSDYDVDQLAERIKKQIADDSMYRNVNTINWIR